MFNKMTTRSLYKLLRNEDCKSFAISLKKVIRARYHKWVESQNPDRKVILTDEDGGYTELLVLATEISDFKDLEEAKDYADTYIRLPEISVPWDCSGQLFTNRLHVFQHLGRWMCIHNVYKDI